MNRIRFKVLAAFMVLSILPFPAFAARLKDVATVAGMRQNQLIGYGLVVGLKNSGDRTTKTPFTAQSLIAMLKRLGTTVDISQLVSLDVGISQTRFLRDLMIENVAAVMVTATLPPFAKAGQKLDVQVSSLGDARSLEGGTLLITPLKAANGDTYAVAQGSLPGVKKNNRKRDAVEAIPTQGVIASGAIVEKEVPNEFATKSQFTILLNKPDFATASSIVAAVDQKYGKGTARGLDGGTVEVSVPPASATNPFGFISEVELLQVKSDMPARVVLDERNGTVIINDHVEVGNVAITIADISVRVSCREKDAATPRQVKEQLNLIKGNTGINELVSALNALGVSPPDLVAIFKALHSSGALDAELEIL